MTETAIIAPVLAAEPAVGRLRRRHTPSGAEGMPAHVTLLVPFTELEQLTKERVTRVAAVLEEFEPVDLVLERCRYLPGPVLYLEPTPSEPFREMTAALVRAFPEHPPYGGDHPDPVPHVTVATRMPREELERIERALAPDLPIETRVDEAWLVAHEPGRWIPKHRFRLRPRVESST